MTIINKTEEKTTQLIAEFKGKTPKAHDRAIVRARFVQTGEGPVALVTIGHDSLKVWDVRANESKLEFESFIEVKKWRCGVQQAAISADGNDLIVIGADSLIHKIVINSEDSESHAVVTHDLGYMEACFVSILPQREAFITASFSGYLSMVGFDGRLMKREPFSNIKHVSAIACSRFGDLIAVATHDGVVKLLDGFALQEKSKCEVHSMKIRALSFSPDGFYLVTGCDDKTIKLVDIKQEKPTIVRVLCGHRAPVTAISLEESEEQRMVTGSLQGEILLWSLEHSTPILKIPSPHETMVSSLSFHPDGQHLVSTGEDRMIAVFTLPQHKPVVPMTPVDEDPEMEEDILDDTQFPYNQRISPEEWPVRFEDEDKENENEEQSQPQQDEMDEDQVQQNEDQMEDTQQQERTIASPPDGVEGLQGSSDWDAEQQFQRQQDESDENHE
ncbi:unnamed protein product, partial [Mesorhabditis belari]|uniref:Anaphase-promoting complex subunit 4-like WD40 domain-containing protein n=1 Tax=Mesorhabditis belari TaxID=2138241 RepID=A0AAF3J2A2_9BILA